ncbi:MAG TPA: RHS repeat-associated core domain-containing protein [Chryseosolibacter sp.]
MTTEVPAYEYFLKDHLGNVRVSFKAITETTELKTNFEEASNSSFLNYPPDNNAYKPSMNDFDHSDSGTVYTRSQRLTGASGLQVGIAKSYEVMAGDVFDIEVFGKFEDKSNTPINLNGLGAAIASALIPSPTGTSLESNAARSGISNAYSGAIVGRSETDNIGAPKAYLNYILFNESFTTILDFGFDQIDASAGGLSAQHDQMSLHVSVQKKGYLYIFIPNENDDCLQDVYFDDFKIKRSTYVESVNDYYPFGLAFNSYQRVNAARQDYKYNSKENQTELNLGWLDYGQRMYQPELGRFFCQDRFSSKYFDFTPYQYGANSPINFVDINGDSLAIPMSGQATLDSMDDLMSLLAGTEVGITANHGNVTLNFGDMTDDEIAELKESNEGVKLLSDLISADEKYLYESSTTERAKDRETGEILKSEQNPALGDPLYSIRNTSDTPRNIDKGIGSADFAVGVKGYNGHVRIGPGSLYSRSYQC